ncbi:hypothetical protein [Halovivax limisalsi]|uniref:hypothetical protein n=1 Tax=Halovivax limisalsi TaxID=1453760 RepID=UPI001FFDE822|nr:hypothetical protein [Halovivax limisalsi]
MDGTPIDRLAERIESVASEGPFESGAELRRWIVRPLLDALGWTVTEEAVRPDVRIVGESVDYLLSVDVDGLVPATLVVIDVNPVGRDGLAAMERAMAATGVDRGLYVTNAELVCVTGGATPERESVRFESFGDGVDTLGQYRRDAVRSRIADLDASRRSHRRLAATASAVRDDIVAGLSDAVDLDPATTRPVVERVIDAVLADGVPNSRGPAGEPASDTRFDRQPSDPSGGDEPTDAPDERRSVEDPTQDATSSAPERSEADSAAPPPSHPPETDREGEFVVRVFNERGSIGAVGHSTSAGALREATEYFFERGLGGVRLPWETDDGVVVLAERPTDGDGTRWNAYERLSNGTFLNTSGTVADRAARVEALADRASLRVMLSGDWENRS